MRDIKISVIVTIHNCENFLETCLSSLLHQNVRENYEVICVNDSSDDKSEEIIDDYVFKYDAIFKKINTNCNNCAEARNLGLSIAQGEYISFVDGDDYVDRNFLYLVYKKAINDDAEVVICNTYHKKKKRIFKSFQSRFSRTSIRTTKRACHAVMYDVRVRDSIYDKFYKKTIFKSVKFLNSDFYNETLVFNFIVFCNCYKVSFVNKRIYYHTRRNNAYFATLDRFEACQKLLNSIIQVKNYSTKIKRPSYFKLPIYFKMGVFNHEIKRTDLSNQNKRIVLRKIKETLKIVKKAKAEVVFVELKQFLK